MLDFLKPYTLILKLLGAAIVLGFVLYGVHKVKRAFEDQAKLESTVKELNAEKACEIGSACAVRVFNDAKKAQDTINEAEQKADKANAEAKQAKEKASQAEADKDAAQVQKHNAELAAILAKTHTASCDEWMKETIKCAMQ